MKVTHYLQRAVASVSGFGSLDETPGAKIQAHLKELGGVLDARSIAQLEGLEAYGTIANVAFPSEKLIVLTWVPKGRGRLLKKTNGVLDQNSLAGLQRALQGFRFELGIETGGFSIAVMV